MALRIPTEGGKNVRQPALTYQTFCPADRAAIAYVPDALPELFVRVHQRLDKTFARSTGGPVVTMSKTAPVPLSLGADELLKLVLATLVS